MGRLRKTASLYGDSVALEGARGVLVPEKASLFTIDLGEIFPRLARLEVEIGAGRGDFIIERAAANPRRNFLAVERPGTVGQVLAMRCGRARLENLRVVRMDARTLVNLMLPDRSVAAYHVYFPDPWPKERHAKHRLFSPFFVQNLARTLELDGVVCVATDLPSWAGEMFARLKAGGFKRTSPHAPGATLTVFARKYLAQGKGVLCGTFEALLRADSLRPANAGFKANSLC